MIPSGLVSVQISFSRPPFAEIMEPPVIDAEDLMADPDGITVEFAVVTEPFTDADATEALEILRIMDPDLDFALPPMKMHKTSTAVGGEG